MVNCEASLTFRVCKKKYIQGKGSIMAFQTLLWPFST